MSHLQQCIYGMHRNFMKDANLEPSPIWVPDTSAPVCMVCEKTTFTLVSRRHHCRKCGVVCCGACSSHRWLLPQQSSSPLRVCTPCYDKLSSPSQQTAVDSAMSRASDYMASQTVSADWTSDFSESDDDLDRETDDTAQQRSSLFYED